MSVSVEQQIRKFSGFSDNLNPSVEENGKEEKLVQTFEREHLDNSEEFQKILITLKEGIAIKTKANNFYRIKKYEEARKAYMKALSNFDVKDEKFAKLLSVSTLDDVRYECMCNIALCSLLLQDYNTTLIYTNEILKTSPKDFKTLYIKVKALIATKKHNEAVISIRQALKIKHSKTLLAYLREYEKDCATIEENVYSEKTAKSSLDTKSGDEENEIKNNENLDENREKKNFISNFTIVKIFKIIFHHLISTVKSNKILFLILTSLFINYFKNGVQQMMISLLKFVKF